MTIMQYVTLKNPNILKLSASRGMFAALAISILRDIRDNRIVYGMVYDSDCKFFYIGIQSDVKHTFSEIKNHLKDKKIVLFSGATCHIAELNSYLNKNYKNIYTVDILRHRVTSPEIFQKYLG